jgi:hypothetical protein
MWLRSVLPHKVARSLGTLESSDFRGLRGVGISGYLRSPRRGIEEQQAIESSKQCAPEIAE